MAKRAGCHMNSPNRSPSSFWAMVILGHDVLVWLFLPFQLLVTVPRNKRVFDDFGMKLPDLTIVVVDVSMWFADYWWIIFLPFLAFLAALVGVGFLC
ncbi:MAG TPA: hypothetical protein VGZ47_10885, partial [Gemmataceae bacterium]|nr:hypothetical protein [Gemmataceae bacterium]